ncbi:MAG: flagellar motor switch protein FliG [Myxococcota bacterium]|jgi:flagellar motor switch protein FliG
MAVAGRNDRTMGTAGTIAAARQLRGAGKTAALLLAMGKPLAGRLLKHFDAGEIRQITRSAAELGPVPADDIAALVDEFGEQFSGGLSLFGSAGEVQKLLSGVLSPEEISEIIGENTNSVNRSIWERLSTMSESALASYLAKEHPQTAAFILSKVRPACASKVMTQWPANKRNELVRRMLNLKPVAEEPNTIVEKVLHEDFTLNTARNKGADTHARMADILNKMERKDMEDTLGSLKQVRPESAEMLKGLLFTFEDIAKLPARSRMAIFDQVSSERIVMALKGTEPHFRELLLSSLAARARRIVQNELDNGEPALQRDVLEARRSITDMALDMAGRGEVELNPEREESAYFQ